MSRRALVISLILITTIVVIYYPVFHFGFVNFDDYDYITTNPRVTTGLTWQNVRWAFTTFYNTNYHPLTWISLQLDVSLFGINPHAMHIENVLLHAACSLLLFRFLYLATKEFFLSAFIALVFAVHPTHVESVAWITERKDVLSTFFLFLALRCYLEVSTNPKIAYGGLLLFYCLGLLAKSMLVTFPFLLLLLDYWPLALTQSQPFKKLLLEKVPLIILATFFSVMTYRSQQSIIAPLHALPPYIRIGNCALAYTGYLQKEFWPTQLSVLYPIRSQVSPFAFTGAMALLICLTVLFVHYRKNRPYLIIGWLWFLGTLIPVIGLVQVGAQAMADRYLYTPSIGLSLIIAYTAKQFLKREISIAIAMIILPTLAILSHHQVKYWRDGYSLFGHASIVLNGDATAQVRLGYEAARQGNITAAREYYQAALKTDPANYAAELNLGNLNLHDHPVSAIEHYQKATLDDPTGTQAQTNWGVALLCQNNPAAAFDHFRLAESLDSNAYDPHYNLGELYLLAKNNSAARAEFRLALEVRPDDPNAQAALDKIASELPK